MDKIQAQANKLWQILTNPATGDTYKQFVALTWSILKETGLLLWLAICLVLVLGDWFWKYSFDLGQGVRIWVDNQQTKPETAESGDFWGDTSKSLLEAGKAAADLALSTAKAQLGIEEAPKPTMSPVSVSAKPATSIPPGEAPASISDGASDPDASDASD